jgi:DnaK suppressor protein
VSSAPGPQDLGDVRRDLQARRDHFREQLDALARPPELGAAQGFGKRIGDGTTEAISRLTDIGVGSSLEQSLARTERALEKLDAGDYGICDACGKPIPAARLEALPDSVLCLTCAAEQRRSAPPRR